MSRKIRYGMVGYGYGMVGGGRGAFIGAIHRIATVLDQQIELVSGTFSGDPQRSKDVGPDQFMPPNRCYGSFEEMLKAESSLPEEERMDFISIVKPKRMHFPPVKADELWTILRLVDAKACARKDAEQSAELRNVLGEFGLQIISSRRLGKKTLVAPRQRADFFRIIRTIAQQVIWHLGLGLLFQLEYPRARN